MSELFLRIVVIKKFLNPEILIKLHMKRGVIIILALILLSSSVFADVVVLTEPEDVTNNQVVLDCASTIDAGTFTKAEFWTDTSGSWAKYSTKTSVIGKVTDIITETITSIPNGDYNWNCKFYNNTANDAYNITAASNGQFTIDYSLNIAPSFIGTIPAQTIPEDTSVAVFDLDDYFTDASALTYSVTGNTSVTVTITSGAVTLLGAANWSGANTLTFTASDGSLTNTSNTVLVTVNAVDDLPYLSNAFSNVTWAMNTNKTVDMGEHFADIDNTTLGYTASNPDHITIYINLDVATLVPETDWFGNVTIIFYANDSKNVTGSNVVTLRVTENSSSGDAPTIDTYLPLSDVVKMKTTQSRTFEVLASDDGDNLTYKWQKDGVDISGATTRTYKLENPALENFTLKIIVSDGTLTATRSWEVEVRGDTTFDEEGDLSVTTPPPIGEIDSILAETTKNKNECGDGIQGPEETCLNCIEDVPCGSNQVCENSVCIEKTGSGFAIAVVLGIIIGIGGIGFFIYRSNTHKQTFNDHRGGIKDQERINIQKIKEAPVSDVNDFYEKHKVSKAQTYDAPEVKESQIERYVKDMRTQGHTENEIADKLKAKGWPDWQIRITLKKIK